MLNLSHGWRARAAGATLAALFALGGLGLAVPAAAQDKNDEKVIVREIRTEAGSHAEIEKMIKDRHPRVEQCEGDPIEANTSATSGDGERRVRIVLCGKKGMAGDDRRKMVESAIERLSNNGDLKPEDRAKIVAELRSKLSQMPAN